MGLSRAERLQSRRAAYRAEKGESVRIDVVGIESTLAALAGVPQGIERARKRALAKLTTFLRREIAGLVSDATGISQRNFLALARLNAKKLDNGGIELWIGTNPIAAQYVGKVAWQRSWTGAKAGRKQFPGSWSWVAKPGAKTGAAIMHRTGGRYAYVSPLTGPQETRSREGIAETKLLIHDLVRGKLAALESRVADRFKQLMAQELRYAIEVENRKRAA